MNNKIPEAFVPVESYIREARLERSAWLGQQSGSPWMIVDPLELDRFSKTYYAIPPLGADFPGPRDHVFILPSQPH